MEALTLTQQQDEPAPALKRDVFKVLEQLDGRRMAINPLHKKVRAMGWRGWSYPKGWPPLCWRLGLYVYRGRDVRGGLVTFVGIDQPNEFDPDEFILSRGFVLVRPDGQFYRRCRSGTHEFTTLRARARMWQRFAWAARTITAAGLGGSVDVISSHHLRCYTDRGRTVTTPETRCGVAGTARGGAAGRLHATAPLGSRECTSSPQTAACADSPGLRHCEVDRGRALQTVHLRTRSSEACCSEAASCGTEERAQDDPAQDRHASSLDRCVFYGTPRVAL